MQGVKEQTKSYQCWYELHSDYRLFPSTIIITPENQNKILPVCVEKADLSRKSFKWAERSLFVITECNDDIYKRDSPTFGWYWVCLILLYTRAK